MTGALLTDTWNSVQQLVEGLRPLMLKVACVGLAGNYKLSLIVCAQLQICRANGGELMGLRPELIGRKSLL